ncbi:Spo0E family sporulation regulatory protein-aspartic acid phosphatase [Thermoactinomyces mirandus]|uniref:Aspartyl-phosphate phosphatase Spo0E family protein n=1 Tax=Thermoactinomyces mirandus TaxID=2756294 RepID=A0A7W1XS58_9BACL|nr:Spo0E family sporulation regulatory protein-aspartic acid phosphatase [Thermoactinomyces mirandus]MBA4602298.1 aspartyl-phosphate phosphatase Spo0E family protein [Thermoactinomyces mirandus]
MNRGPALKERLETVRRRMEEAADCLGLNHPTVYQLSLELDQLHNMWEKEIFNKRETDRICRFRSPVKPVNERSKDTMMQAI